LRILVTGHRGYIGVVMTRVLLSEGFEVVGLDTDLYRDATFGDRADLPTVPTIDKDVRDVGRDDLVGFDSLVHSAALSYLIRDLAELVAEVVPGCEVEYAGNVSADSRIYRVGCGRIERELGFRTTWTGRAGVAELAEAFRSQRLTLDDFQGLRYQRIAEIRRFLATDGLTDQLMWRDSGSPSPR
jgi:nucleoside-diphosphate-sugar epimerase